MEFLRSARGVLVGRRDVTGALIESSVMVTSKEMTAVPKAGVQIDGRYVIGAESTCVNLRHFTPENFGAAVGFSPCC